MRKLLIKITIAFTIAITAILVRIIVPNFYHIKKHAFQYIPLNNVSNSSCFRAKVDHLMKSENFRKCSFLVAGSSMSLNNISGEVIRNKTNEYVYNISSWGIKPEQLNQFLKILDIDRIKYLLFAFDNWDFGENEMHYDIDYKATDQYINGNNIMHYWSVISTFNYNTFSKDWDYRYKFSDINNTYASMNFDEYGSVLFDTAGFQIDTIRWNEYRDTTGFNIFYNSLTDLESICKQNKTKLIIVYLPTRPNLLPERNVRENIRVSEILRKRFYESYIDMQNADIPQYLYCDGTHLFREGADKVTGFIMDTLIQRRQICLTGADIP